MKNVVADGDGRRLDVRAFSEIESRPVEWMWPGRIRYGGLTAIVGRPRIGKTLLAVDIAAAVSRQFRWPDATSAYSETHGVTFICNGEHGGRYLTRRLVSAGAHELSVRVLGGSPCGLADTEADVRDALDKWPECRLIVADAICAGGRGVRAARDSALALARIARDREVAAVVVCGSRAGEWLGGLPDVVLGVSMADYAAGTGKRVVRTLKNKFGTAAPDVGFRVASGGEGYGVHLEWDADGGRQ